MTPFIFPPKHSFPPFYTLQPVPSTRQAQMRLWSSIVQAYCRHNHLFRLSVVDAVESPLFRNDSIGRALSLLEVRAVLDWMVSSEGGGRAEWEDTEHARCWVYWRRPEEWAAVLEDWADRTGMKNTVLTLYELLEGEATTKEEFYRMDAELLRRALNVLAKRGKAQVFGGNSEELGVKFY